MQNPLGSIGHGRSGSCTTPHLTADLLPFSAAYACFFPLKLHCNFSVYEDVGVLLITRQTSNRPRNRKHSKSIKRFCISTSKSLVSDWVPCRRVMQDPPLSVRSGQRKRFISLSHRVAKTSWQRECSTEQPKVCYNIPASLLAQTSSSCIKSFPPSFILSF
jgi:hypothetical protein